MNKKIFEFNGKRFIVESNSSEEILNYIEKRLKELNEKYSDLSSTDERFLAMLCDILENEYNSIKKLKKLIENVKKLEEPGIEDRAI